MKRPSEEPWKNGAAQTVVEAQTEYLAGNSKAAVDTLRMFLTEVQLPAGGHRDRRDHRDTLKVDTGLNITIFDFLRGMPTIDNTLKDWTEQVTAYIKTKLKLTVDLGLKQKGKAFYEQNLKTLLIPVMTIAYPVSTVHKVKGMTFQSVLLVLSEDSKAAKISLSDFTRPAGLPTEKQRMIYVALSRPELLACIAVPNTSTQADIRAVLGDNIEFA